MSNFELTVIYGSFAIISLFMGGFWWVIFKQVIPTMLFAVVGFFLMGMGYTVSPFREDN